MLGSGCAYPTSTKTLASQLTAAGDTWKAYVQGVPSNAKSACRVPKVGSKVPQTAGSKNAYVAWRNPFVYFSSLTSGSSCHDDEVGLGRLKTDLKSASTTPSLAYIIPAPCSDGSETPCKPHAKPGLAGANQFLKTVVPEIKTSPAYKDGGIDRDHVDQAPQTGQYADPSACCASPAAYPNLRGLPPGTPVAPAGATGPAVPGTTPTGAMAADTTTTDTTTTDTTTTHTTTTTPTTTDTTTSGSTTTTTGTTTTGPTTAAGTTTTDHDHDGVDDDHRRDDHWNDDHRHDHHPNDHDANLAGQRRDHSDRRWRQVGLLLISSYVKANSFDAVDYFNHFSLLATIENLFGYSAGLRRRSRAPAVQHGRVQQLRGVRRRGSEPSPDRSTLAQIDRVDDRRIDGAVVAPVSTPSIASTMSIPSATWPNTVCLPSSPGRRRWSR